MITQSNTGHGHVVPRADCVKMRCGGPALCSTCQAEKRTLEAQFATLSPAHIEDGEEVDWSCLPGYLIDHYEGWPITEEGLQFAISEMLKDPDYLRVQAEKAALSAPPAAGVQEAQDE